MKILIKPTSVSEWYSLVTETQVVSGCQLDENIQNYLVITLDKFTKDYSLITSIICMEFFKTLSIEGSLSHEKLRNIGDRCLLLSGLFPDRAKSMNLTDSYFSEIGQDAYLTLADKSKIKYDPVLFHKLGQKFKELAELLNKMREVHSERSIN